MALGAPDPFVDWLRASGFSYPDATGGDQPVAPPAPDPQQIGPSPQLDAPPIPMPVDTSGGMSMPPELGGPVLPPPTDAAAPEPQKPLVPVGSGVDAFGMEKPEQPTAPAGVDAVSGAAEATPKPEPLQPVGNGNSRMFGLSAEEIASLNPIERTKYFADQNQDREDFASREAAKLQATNAAKAEAAEREYLAIQERSKQMTEAALADADALAKEKPSKFTDSGWNVFSGIAGIMLSSLVSPEAGKNAAQMVQQRADRFAQQQIDEYNRKSGAVDRKLNMAARLKDAGYADFQVKRVIQQTAYQRALDQLSTDVQNYDPKGSAAMKRYQAIEQTKQAMAQNAIAMQKESLDYEIKKADLYNKQLDAQTKAKKLAGNGAGGAKHPPEYFASQGIPRPPVAMTDKEYDAWQRRDKSAAELAKTRQEISSGANTTGLSKEELERYVPGFGLAETDAEGNEVIKPFLGVGMPEEIKGLRKKAVSTKKLVRLMDEALRIRTGWSSDSAKSDEWRQLKANWAAAIGEAKGEGGLNLGVLTGPDMDLAGEFIGTKDPTEFRDPSAGILKARQNLINALNDEAVGLAPPGSKLKRFEIPRPQLGAAVESPSDRAFKNAQRNDPFEKVERGVSASEAVNEISPKTKLTIDSLTNVARYAENDSEKEEARLKLENLMETAPNDGVRDAVRDALLMLGTNSSTYEEATGQGQQTARETAPPVPRQPTEAEKAQAKRKKGGR